MLVDDRDAQALEIVGPGIGMGVGTGDLDPFPVDQFSQAAHTDSPDADKKDPLARGDEGGDGLVMGRLLAGDGRLVLRRDPDQPSF